MVVVYTYVGRQIVPQSAKALRPRRSKFIRGKLEEARLKIIDTVAVSAGLAVRQGTLVAFRRLPCARGRVS